MISSYVDYRHPQTVGRMKILAVPASYGLSRPVSGGMAAFVDRLRMQIENQNLVSVLQSDVYRDPRDSEVADVSYFTELRFAGRDLVVFRDLNPFLGCRLVRSLATINPDVVEFNNPGGIFLSEIACRILRRRRILVYQAHNVESDFIGEVFSSNPKYGALERRLVPPFVSLMEALACRYLADHITTFTEKDRRRLIDKYHLPPSKVTTIGIGRRVKSQGVAETKTELRGAFGFGEDDIVVVFLGAAIHRPNQEAVKTIREFVAPAVGSMDKSILFVIAGEGFAKFREANVLCLGFVEDLEKLLWAADVAIAPIYKGGGIKVKLLDYMAAGLPIVATAKAIEGTEVEAGKQAIVVEKVDGEFAEAIVRLARFKETRLGMSEHARRLMSTVYDWGAVRGRLDHLYRRLAHDGHGRPIR